MTQQEQQEIQDQQATKLVEMAQRTFKSNRPLFIMVQYNHEADKLSFITKVNELAHTQSITTSRYDPLNNDEHGATKLYPLLEKDAKDKTLSLVISMPRIADGDELEPDFLSYINLHRDSIAHKKLHFVLFLRENEMARFIEGASDLWSFRHRTFRLERDLTQSSDILWQNIEQMQEAMTLSDEEKQLIKTHVQDTKMLIGETVEIEAKAQLWFDLTVWLDRHNAPQMAIETAIEGIGLLDGQVFELLGDFENQLGLILGNLSNYSEALNHLKLALDIAQEVKDKDLEGCVYNNIATIYQAKGDYDTSLHYLNLSLPLRQSIEDKKGEGTTLNNISQIHQAKGDYETALHYLNLSLAIQQAIGDKTSEGSILNNISLFHEAKGDFDTALTFLNKSLNIRQDIGDRDGEGKTLNNIAQIHRQRGDSNTALQFSNRALSIQRSIGDKLGEGVSLSTISLYYSSKGDYDTALNYLNQSLSIKKNIGNKASLCTTLFNIGCIHWQKNEQDKAMKVWLSVYQLAKPMGLAHALNALEGLAEKVGLPTGLEGWEALSKADTNMASL